MKKLMTIIIASLLLVSLLGLVLAKNSFSITASAINNNSEEGNQNQMGAGNGEEVQTQTENETELEEEVECEEWTCTKWGACLNEEKTRACTKTRDCVGEQDETPRLTKRCEEKERLFDVKRKTIDCAENCTCTGSVTKCILPDGTREMTIRAGKSGNVIVQVRGINVSTSVTLYKADDGKFYAINKNNETKRIKILPDQVRERIEEKIQKRLENENITLGEDGVYRYEAKKRARLFFIFPVRERIQAEINPETGKIIQIRNPWWGFLAKDEEAEPIVGASCGTVTPGENDNCCINKGYDLWNSETEECEFNVED